MKITIKKLDKLGACEKGKAWFVAQKETDLSRILFALLEDDKANWANWLIVRYMTKRQKIQYAIYAAEQVLAIFEKKYPDDRRPRKAIEAAAAYLKSPTAKNKAAADAAADAAAAAAYAANAAADAAAYAAKAAADAAAAAYAANAAADAAAYAANAAADAAAYADADARGALQTKIVKYGLRLIGNRV